MCSTLASNNSARLINFAKSILKSVSSLKTSTHSLNIAASSFSISYTPFLCPLFCANPLLCAISSLPSSLRPHLAITGPGLAALSFILQLIQETIYTLFTLTNKGPELSHCKPDIYSDYHPEKFSLRHTSPLSCCGAEDNFPVPLQTPQGNISLMLEQLAYPVPSHSVHFMASRLLWLERVADFGVLVAVLYPLFYA